MTFCVGGWRSGRRGPWWGTSAGARAGCSSVDDMSRVTTLTLHIDDDVHCLTSRRTSSKQHPPCPRSFHDKDFVHTPYPLFPQIFISPSPCLPPTSRSLQKPNTACKYGSCRAAPQLTTPTTSTTPKTNTHTTLKRKLSTLRIPRRGSNGLHPTMAPILLQTTARLPRAPHDPVRRGPHTRGHPFRRHALHGASPRGQRPSSLEAKNRSYGP